jgi:phosphoribosyl-dephospho-CoA transferase
MFTFINPPICFLCDYLKDCAYCANLHTVQELQTEIEAVDEEFTDDSA